MTHKQPPIARERLRKLMAAYDGYNRKREELLAESPDDSTHEQRVELRRRADEGLRTLLEEGLTRGSWTVFPKESGEKECILIEDEQYNLPVLRRAPREAVELAPEWAPAQGVEENAPALLKSRYRLPISRVVTAFGLTGLAFCLGGVVAVLVSVISDTDLWSYAAVGIIAFVLCSVIFNFSERFMPDSPEQISASGYDENEKEEEIESSSAGERDRETDSDVEDEPPTTRNADAPCTHDQQGTVTPRAAASEHFEIQPLNLECRRDAVRYYEHFGAPSNVTTGYNGRAWNPLEQPADDNWEGANQDPDELHHQQDQSRRDRLEGIREEDLGEEFSYAYRRVENQERGSESIRVIEARGELAGALGVSQGEALMEIAWRVETRAGCGRSYLPYREVAAGTSLDPALPPAQRVRPESRAALHEIIEAEKATAGLSPKVTYRIGPDREQFFNLPNRSEGCGAGYTLKDKLEYLQGMASRLGFEGHYTGEELERMDEIMLGEGYAPENEELLRFALVAGIDPRFFFEQDEPGEDLRSAGHGARKPVWLWRVEAAISEAHGLPVEVFERKLIPWYVSRHSWRFA